MAYTTQTEPAHIDLLKDEYNKKINDECITGFFTQQEDKFVQIEELIEQIKQEANEWGFTLETSTILHNLLNA